MLQVCIPLLWFYGYPNEHNRVCGLCASLPESDRTLLIIQRRSSTAQASPSFECLEMCGPAHAIPTFVTEALHLVVYARLFLNDYESEVMAYTVLACS